MIRQGCAGHHLTAFDAVSGEQIKDAVRARTINV
jgi:hypothetical protein